MKIETFKIRLVPDKNIPLFKRLAFERVDVPLVDVFRKGVHPHSVADKSDGKDATDADDAIMAALNAEEAFVPDLKAHNLGQEVSRPHRAYGDPRDRVEVLLQEIGKNIYFVDNVDYGKVVEKATARLREIWSHRIADSMAHAVGGDFAGIRAFLKRKKPDIKLTGYESLQEYDLAQVTESLRNTGCFRPNRRVIIPIPCLHKPTAEITVFALVRSGCWNRV